MIHIDSLKLEEINPGITTMQSARLWAPFSIDKIYVLFDLKGSLRPSKHVSGFGMSIRSLPRLVHSMTRIRMDFHSEKGLEGVL